MVSETGDDGAASTEEPGRADEPARPRRRNRRVRTEPVPGTDPNPTPEPSRHGEGENDEQLKRDVPPHWG